MRSTPHSASRRMMKSLTLVLMVLPASLPRHLLICAWTSARMRCSAPPPSAYADFHISSASGLAVGHPPLRLARRLLGAARADDEQTQREPGVGRMARGSGARGLRCLSGLGLTLRELDVVSVGVVDRDRP